MNAFVETWNQLGKQARFGIVFGVVLILGLALSLGLWAYRADYQVLFSDVAPADAASMTAELDRMKVPYQLADEGHTILVPKEMVYKTRLKLMGKELPLHGAVGFEVFNNADFGMTEFVQKVNYQRAIQGELTRTILSIEDVQSARVHLAIPEQGLFKKSSNKPKASVTLAMKPGKSLAPDQITGIQRLVAASVPDIVADDVTVLDQHGVALTRVPSIDGVGSASAQLDSKRGTEEYLLRKVTQVLDRTFGPGQAIASVDVMLNLDQSKVTTEEVLPAKSGSQEGSPTGVVVRERQTTREGGAGASPSLSSAGKGSDAGSMTSVESDYQVGRRVEQLVTAAGSLRRMTIAVVVKKPLTDEQLEKLKEVIGSAAGFSSQRGDAIVVHSVDRLASTAASGAETTAATSGMTMAQELPNTQAAVENRQAAPIPFATKLIGASLLAVILIAAFIYAAQRSGKRQVRRQLSDADRQKMLIEVRQWILQAPASSNTLPGGQV